MDSPSSDKRAKTEHPTLREDATTTTDFPTSAAVLECVSGVEAEVEAEVSEVDAKLVDRATPRDPSQEIDAAGDSETLANRNSDDVAINDASPAGEANASSVAVEVNCAVDKVTIAGGSVGLDDASRVPVQNIIANQTATSADGSSSRAQTGPGNPDTNPTTSVTTVEHPVEPPAEPPVEPPVEPPAEPAAANENNNAKLAVEELPESNRIDPNTLEEVNQLLWGNRSSNEIFLQWFQGLNFSVDEPTFLLQVKGGPCALIAPLQAFVLRRLLFVEPTPANWRLIHKKKQDLLLVDAIYDIITAIDTTLYCVADIDVVVPITAQHFKSKLRMATTSSKSILKGLLTRLLPALHEGTGVLLLLYSLVLSKGVAAIQAEVQDGGESFIDERFGHGGQCLINLALTGYAVSNVFDGSKDCGGMVLRGIEYQSEIGFLTLLEHLRYCEVGWNYKNPKNPIWVLGSETHLTVLFSQDRGLVELDSPLIQARKTFNVYDATDQGFIMNDKLGDLMRDLDLVSEPEYVNIMLEKLDPEKFGIVTSQSFFNEFFSNELLDNASIATYDIFHYNGLNNTKNEVKYSQGTATIAQLPEYQLVSDATPIKSCCLTKWPSVELAWRGDHIPKLM